MYDAEDALRHVAGHAAEAVLRARRMRDSPLFSGPASAEELQGLLEHVLNVVAEHVAVLGIDATRYGDGTPVTTHAVLSGDGGDGPEVFSHVWHPNPADPVNQPRVVHDSVTLMNGERRRLMVTARGVLDAVPVVGPAIGRDD